MDDGVILSESQDRLLRALGHVYPSGLLIDECDTDACALVSNELAQGHGLSPALYISRTGMKLLQNEVAQYGT
jgi:hypothetical protein